MKKTILTLITHCAIIYSACSQTNYIVPTASSGTIYQDPTSSNIGIGTATPAYPLDVSGNANVSGTLSAAAFQLAAGAGAGYLLTSDSSGNAGWAPPAAGTGWALISPDILNTNSGGIGIGVSLADSFFSSPLPFVFGVSNERYSGSGIPPFLAMIDNQVDTGTGGGLPGASAFSFLVLRSFAGNPNGDPAVDFVVNNTGMVGVGGLPDIADNGVLNANFFVSAYDTLKALMGVVTYAGMPALVVATNGNVGIGTATPAAALDVSGNAHVSGTLAAGSIQLTGGTPIAGYLVQTDGTGHLSFTPPPTGSCATCVWAYATDGTDIYNTNPGLVGVGTYAPTSTLTVSAGILSTSSGTTPSSVIEINNNSAHESIGDELIFLETNVANSLIVKRNSTTESTSGPGGTTATTTDFVVTSSGFTGIGTATPQSALDVSGGISLGTYAGTIAAPANGMIVSGILGVGTSTPAYKLDVTGDARITANTIIEGSLGIGTTAPAFNLDVNGNARVSGSLAVGGESPTTSPYNGYKLAVNGLIVSKEVIVETGDWADKVFEKSYQLMPLTELKKYLDENHHLPDMPTECDAIDKGVNLGEMNKLLLQKVEELTLYMINQQKEIDVLKAKK
jgi:hypothetical protein